MSGGSHLLAMDLFTVGGQTQTRHKPYLGSWFLWQSSCSCCNRLKSGLVSQQLQPVRTLWTAEETTSSAPLPVTESGLPTVVAPSKTHGAAARSGRSAARSAHIVWMCSSFNGSSNVRHCWDHGVAIILASSSHAATTLSICWIAARMPFKVASIK